MLPSEPYRRLSADRLRIGRYYSSASKELQERYLANCIAVPSLEEARWLSDAAKMGERQEAVQGKGLAPVQTLLAITQQNVHVNDEPVMKALRAQCSKNTLLELRMAMTPSKLPRPQLEALPVQSSDEPSFSHPIMALTTLEVPVLPDAMQVNGFVMHSICPGSAALSEHNLDPLPFLAGLS